MSANRFASIVLAIAALVAVGCGDGGGDGGRPPAPSVDEARYGTIGNVLVSEAASQGAPRQRLWIGFSRAFAWRNLHIDLDELPPGKRLWIAGRVVRDPETPPGFFFDPATTVTARTVGPLRRATLSSLRAHTDTDDGLRAIQVTIDAIEPTPNAPTCGNLVLDPGEQCEIGGFCPSGECNPELGPCFDFFCRFDCKCPVPECGDYQVQPGETCDPPGSKCNGGTGTCQHGCTCGEGRCGDGALNPGEECDFALVSTCEAGRPCGDDCRCPTEARCGDGALEPGEQCDPFGCADNEFCSDTCVCVPAVCGNGLVEFTEQCEPNSPPFDGCVICDPSLTSCRKLACRADCTCDSPCGDGIYGGHDECDDGNLRDGDGCSAECRVECGGEVCPAESVCCDYELGPCAASYTGCTF